MRTVFLYGCFSIAMLMASEAPESGAVSSTNAAYDGNALLLTGHVVLDHGLGKMTAEEASLQKQEIGKDFPFSVIALRKDVRLALKNSGELLCERADLDFNALTGVLHAKGEGKVVYSDTYKKKKETLPFTLAGRRVELLFAKQGAEGKKSEYDIETILVKEDVDIDYASAFQLHAGHALYRKPGSLSSESKEFQGVITAYPSEEEPCRLVHGVDLIDADTIDLDMAHSTLSLLHPKGQLATQGEPMHFTADQLCWDHVTGTLILNGHIWVQEAALGTITAQEQLELTYKTLKGKQVLKGLQTRGHTSLTYLDPSFTRPHKLICHGKMHIDRDKLLAALDSPEDQQLYYEEDEIGVFANHATLEYTETDERLKPISLQLKGNIRLFSHDPKQPPRCGLADRLHYSLSTRTLILSAHPGSNVLFWDEAQGVRMSASEVHILTDEESKERVIKGVGKVRLTLTAEEQSHLKQLFPHYKVAL